MKATYPKGHSPLKSSHSSDNLYIEKHPSGGAQIAHIPRGGSISYHGVFPNRSSAQAHIAMHFKSKAKKSLTQHPPEGEVMVKSFEEFFETDVEKSMKKKGKKGGVAKKIGNEMDPHRGGKTGSFVDHKRPGSLGSAVDRDHAKKPHAPRTGVVKSFPYSDSVQVVSYTAASDTVLAQQLESGELHQPSLRNLQTEKRVESVDDSEQ